MVNLKSSRSEIKLFWKFTKKQPRLSCAWTFYTFKSSHLNNYFEICSAQFQSYFGQLQ